MTDEAWPVGREAELEVPSHPDLRFVAITDGYRCSVHALRDLIAVGSLRWLIDWDEGDNAGMIGFVWVSLEMRRRGIATAMLAAARAYAVHYHLPPPHHVADRTPEGDAWAVADGAPPSAEVTTYDRRPY